MVRRFAIVAVVLVLLAATAFGADNSLHLEGIAYTGGAAKEVRIQVWAQGEQVAEHPEWEFEPVFKGVTTPGKAFTVKLAEPRIPVLVELSADDHVAVSLRVVVDEQAALPPAWLRTGEPLRLRVMRSGVPAHNSLVWGSISTEQWSRDPQRWKPAVPHVTVPEGGSLDVSVPPDGSWVAFVGLTRSREFGIDSFRELKPSTTVTLAIDSVPAEVRVRDRRGRPVPGMEVIEASSPAGAAQVTDDDGRATVQIPGDGEWKLLTLGAEGMGRTVGHSVPSGSIDVDLVPRTDVEIRWPKELGPLVLNPSWLPGPLDGTPRAHHGGSATFPVMGKGGNCRYWGPSIAYAEELFEGVREPIVLNAKASVRLEGRVVAPEGFAVAGLPVWVRLSPFWMLRQRGWMAGRRDVPLTRPWLPWSVTDTKGRFSVAGLPPAEYQAEVRVSGFPAALGERMEGQPGAVLETVVRLVPGATLSLKVVDPGGSPLEGVTAGVFRSAKPSRMAAVRIGGGGRHDPEVTETTDSEGNLKLRSVPVGVVRLRLSRPGSVTRSIDQIEVPAEGADIGEVTLTPGVTVSGLTVGPDGEPEGGAEVAMDRDPQMSFFRPTITSGPDGHFSIPDLEPSGELYLQARADGLVPAAPLKVEMPPEGEVEITMATERVLEGKVVRARDDTGVADAQIVATVNKMVVVGRGGRSMSIAGDANSDDQGTFRLGGLAAGRYEIAVSAQGLQDAQQTVVVSGEADPEPVVFRLEEGLELRGRVETATGEPVVGLPVVARRASGSIGVSISTGMHSARTSADGRFVFDDLGSGPHRLFARSEDGPAAEATATAGQEEEVVLRFEAGEVIEGIVWGEDGAPIFSATVRAYGRGIAGYPPVSDTGSDGRFRFENVQTGQWTVRAEAEGFLTKSEPLEVLAGEVARVELRLERGATVIGEVRGLSATELERCHVLVEGGGWTSPLADGSFRITSAADGEHEVTAVLRTDGRQRSVRVTVPEVGESEPVVIDFASGLLLTGRVLREGRGVSGLSVLTNGVVSRGGGGTVSGAEGAYRIEGLEPGEYEIAVLSPAGEVLVGDHVLLETDTELDLEVSVGRLSGWVLETDTEKPIEGATVRVTGAGPPAVVRMVATDVAGAFAIEELPDGDYQVRAEFAGRNPVQEQVAIRNMVPASVTLHLGNEETTVLVVREHDGSPASRVFIMSAQGGVAGPSIFALCTAGGHCEVRDLPRGAWTLLVRGNGMALIGIEVPGGEIPVTLSQSGSLDIRAPVDDSGAAWQVRVTDTTSGLVLPTTTDWASPGRGEWAPVPSRGLRLPVPAGTWRIDAFAPDGTQSAREVIVPGGGDVTVELE